MPGAPWQRRRSGLARPAAVIRAHGRSAGRRSGGPAVFEPPGGPLDLQHLMLLVSAQSIDLGDEPVGDLLELVQVAVRRVAAQAAVPLFLLQGVAGIPAMVADLDLGLLHPAMNDLDDVAPALLGEGRDIEPDDRAIDVRGESDVALLDRFLDRPEDTPVPRLDHDLVGLRHADSGDLVERRWCAVVLHDEALDEGGRRPAGAQPLEVALHALHGAGHLRFDRADHLGAHPLLLPEINVPTASPRATRTMLLASFRSKTTIGRSFSMHSDTAAASITLRWSRSRSAYTSSA